MILDLLISCSGANKGILQECPTERTKFVGIGATILLTSILASISGGYAIYFTFKNILISILFGILWGVVIFNLDRYIVSSIKKTGDLKKELLLASPRLLIAIVLAITVSKPLEVRLFNGSISKKIGQLEDKYNSDCEADFNKRIGIMEQHKSGLMLDMEARRKDVFSADGIYSSIEKEKNLIIAENNDLQSQIQTNRGIIAKNSWVDKIVVNSETGETRNVRRYNQEALDKIGENKRLNGEMALNEKNVAVLADSLKSRQTALASQVAVMEKQYGAQIAAAQKQIDDFNQSRPAILDKCKREAALDTDILSSLRALGELKSFGNSVWWASLLVTLLFVLIEIAPLVVKLLAKRGPYDEVLDRLEHEIYLEQMRIISDKNNELNNLLTEIKEIGALRGQVRVRADRDRLDAEAKANKALLDDIVVKQAELAKISVDRWYKEQRSKLGEDAQEHE